MFNPALGLFPVLLFLLLLVLMDSFKLVRPVPLVLAMMVGSAAAIVAAPLHQVIIRLSGIDPAEFSRYVAPITEETIKALYVVTLIARGRVGFLVDAALHGFAIGTGFALIENIDYLRAMPDAPALLWIVRGLGSAVLHGATTAIVAITAKSLIDRRPGSIVAAAAPGWLVGVLLHSAYNQLLLPPIAMTLLILIVVPVLLLYVFHRSEQATRDWVGAGLDLDVELIQHVLSGQFAQTRPGAYLRQLRARFQGPIVADMFCLVRLELELSAQAKGMLIARQAGLELPVSDDLRPCLQELRFLQTSIGRTGLLALKPLQVTSHRHQWHRFLLEQAGN